MSQTPDHQRALGVCYYPEHWPEARWSQDARIMTEVGLKWVRIGEFAWSRIEPQPGNLQWDWLDRAVETLADAGLKIIMGTPTATPPRWMLDKWPDMLALDANGRPRKFGSRRHYCFSHRGYREECQQIASYMAERYATHPGIAAWQIDNEYDCHETTVSYSEHARIGFHNWLAKKYGTIDNLNAVWGNIFWSMEYSRFGDIDLPNLTVTEPNPSHALDFKRYSAQAVVNFNKNQVDVLRGYTTAPLIHNYMGRTVAFDHYEVGADLDIASWDSYPLGFLEDRSDRPKTFKRDFMRQGDPDFQAFHHDIYRAVGRGRWWVMEQQPGPVNWAPYNPAPLPGMPRLWAWEAFAHGAETVCYFRWRQAPFAQEQMHAGLLRPDGAPAQAYAEATQVGQELQKLPEAQSGEAPVGLVFDYQSAWAWEVQPQGQDFDYFRLCYAMYTALRQMGLDVDILPPDTDDFGARKLILIPGLLYWREALKTALESFEGTVIAGPRTGSKTEFMVIPAKMPPEMPGVEAVVDRVETLRPDSPIPLVGQGHFQFWREFVETSAPVRLRTQDNAPALIGSDTRQYLCGWPDEVGMMAILRPACAAAGLKPWDLPEGLRVRSDGRTRFVFNYSAVAHVLPAEFGSLAGHILPAAGVLAIDIATNTVLMGDVS